EAPYAPRPAASAASAYSRISPRPSQYRLWACRLASAARVAPDAHSPASPLPSLPSLPAFFERLPGHSNPIAPRRRQRPLTPCGSWPTSSRWLQCWRRDAMSAIHPFGRARRVRFVCSTAGGRTRAGLAVDGHIVELAGAGTITGTKAGQPAVPDSVIGVLE